MEFLIRLTKLVFLTFLLINVSPLAYGHDILVDQAPSKNQTLTQVPEKIVLTFNNNLFDMGASFAVRDENGTEYGSGEAIIENNTATQILETNIVSGEYTVAWRVVSSDGHPISGTYSFFVKLETEETQVSPPVEENISEEKDTNNSSLPIEFLVIILLTITTILIVLFLLFKNFKKDEGGNVEK